MKTKALLATILAAIALLGAGNAPAAVLGPDPLPTDYSSFHPTGDGAKTFVMAIDFPAAAGTYDTIRVSHDSDSNTESMRLYFLRPTGNPNEFRVLAAYDLTEPETSTDTSQVWSLAFAPITLEAGDLFGWSTSASGGPVPIAAQYSTADPVGFQFMDQWTEDPFNVDAVIAPDWYPNGSDTWTRTYGIQVVPEPSSAALAGFAALLLGLRRSRFRK